jgi:ferredoxin
MDTVGLIVLGLGSLFGLGAFGLLSLREGERRAARVGLSSAVAASALFFLATLLPAPGQLTLLGAVIAAGMAGVVLFLLPIGRVKRGRGEPRSRFDERDIMFARARLVPGEPNYNAYYTLRPENKASDDKTRSLPGLLSGQAREANPLVFDATEASFGLTEALRETVDGPVVIEPRAYDAVTMSAYIKSLAVYHGAHSVGITELRPYHVYSHTGRGSGEYGAAIELEHRYAIAFTVEMDHGMVGTAPAAPITLESARQYVEAAKIAVQVGNLARSLGYSARAHIDGNYRVIAPLVARDAGLGEIGRMGLLMTPRLGPRVRLGVVTTDLPLIPDRRNEDLSVIDFCRICKKCAENCPVRAIPEGDWEEIDGALRWRIDADLCYRYWCVAVCPYSHPENLLHNLIRWAVAHSGAARRTMLWLDDIFYGSKPAPRPTPDWVPPKPVREQTRLEDGEKDEDGG